MLRKSYFGQVCGRPVYSESQCGIDGRMLKPRIAELLKKAKFLNPRIAWDHGYDERERIEQQIQMLVDAGYRSNDIYVFMIYNFDLPFREMLKKIRKCKDLGVPIADCRYRPLDQLYDNYMPLSIPVQNNFF